jgi:cytochrome P450
MRVTMTATTTPEELTTPFIGQAPPSPAGPARDGIGHLRQPPEIPLSPTRQTLRFSVRQIEFVFGARRRLGEVFRMRTRVVEGGTVVTSHPDHIKSLFTADPAEAPSLTGESPLRPIVGPNSTLTALGDRHMRQRKLLLPSFHGEAVARYTAMIEAAAEREVGRWPVGEPFALAPRMQAITLDVIMAGIFGIEGRPERGTPEHRLRQVIRQLVVLSTLPISQVAELLNTGSDEAVGPTKVALGYLDRATYAVIR